MKKKNIFKLVFNLYKHFSKKRKIEFLFLTFVTLIFSITEVVSVGVLIPFMDVMVGGSDLSKYLNLISLDLNLNIQNDKLFVTLAFFSLIFITILFKIIMSYLTPKYVHKISHDLTVKVYSSTIYQNYKFHKANSTHQLVSNIDLMNQTLGSLKIILEGISAIMNILFLLAFLLIVELKITMIVFILIFTFFLTTSLILKLALYNSSILITKYVNQKYKILNESIGNIKEILLNASQESFVKEFSANNWKLNNRFIFQAVASLMPGHIIMFLVMTIFIFLIYYLSISNTSFIDVIPKLSALLFAIQKLLPHCQTIYRGYSKIQGQANLFFRVINILNKGIKVKLKNNLNKYEFKNNIKFDRVNFSYFKDKKKFLSMKTVSFEIKKNEFTAIIGKTGSGKSTLVDLIMGLLDPSSGKILVDGKSIKEIDKLNWTSIISHVSQNIFLFNTSIEKNLISQNSPTAFDKLVEKSKIACAHEFIIKKKYAYKTIIGERGLRLSGGQKQRLSLARALLREPQILILDESMSGLDYKTENKILKNLRQIKNLTVIYITHRISLIKNFDKIIKLK